MKTRMIVIMLAMTLIGVQAFAGPSYTSNMSFSQGFDLETGVVDQGIQKLLDKGTDSPDVIRLVFVVQDIEPQQVMYSFDPDIDFQVGYDEEEQFLGLLPYELSAVAILDNLTFDAVTTLDLNLLDFSYDPMEIRFDPDYTLIVYTADENFYKLGNFALVDSGVSFDWEKIENVTANAVPEPATIALFSLGIVGIGVLVKRMRSCRIKGMVILSIISLSFLSTSAAYAVLQSSTGFYYPADRKDTGGLIGWLSFNSKYNQWHLGVDFRKNEGDAVYAISDGTVIYSRTDASGYGCSRTPGGAMVVKHQTSDGKDFIALYGHVKNMKRNGSEVKAGEQIAAIGPCFQNITHLHFGIHPNGDVSSLLKAYSSSRTNTLGCVDPLNFIETKSPLNKTPKTFSLGGVDLDAYCRRKGYDGVSLGSVNDPYSWSCKNSHTNWISASPTWSGISVNQACQEQYPRYANVFAKAGNWSDAYSWTCYAKRSYTLKIWRFRKTITYNQRLGGVNIRAFCEKDRARGQRGVNEQRLSVRTRYRDVSHNSNDAGSWRCQGKQEYRQSTTHVGISVTDACRIQKKNPTAYARVTNRNSAFSWQCYVDKTVYKSTFQSLTTSTSKTEFWVSVNKSGTGSGTVSAGDVNCGSDCAGGAYKVGSFVDLKAIPDATSDFVGWLVNGQPASGAIPVSSDPVLTAKFDKKPDMYPVITGVSPNPVPRKTDWSRQWFTVYGRSFQPGAKLLFKIVGTNYVYPDRVPDYISSTELQYYISVGPNVYDWTVEVINPDGRGSNAYGFQVR